MVGIKFANIPKCNCFCSSDQNSVIYHQIHSNQHNEDVCLLPLIMLLICLILKITWMMVLSISITCTTHWLGKQLHHFFWKQCQQVQRKKQRTGSLVNKLSNQDEESKTVSYFSLDLSSVTAQSQCLQSYKIQLFTTRIICNLFFGMDSGSRQYQSKVLDSNRSFYSQVTWQLWAKQNRHPNSSDRIGAKKNI